MGRDLKQEYEEMLDQEIPDLWSRIEPALADKKARLREKPSKNPVRFKRSTIAVISSLAAACVCLAVILPAWRGNQKKDNRTNYESAADNNAAAQDTAQTENGMMNNMEPEDVYDGSAGGYDGFAADMSAMAAEELSKADAEADEDTVWTDGAEQELQENTEALAGAPEESPAGENGSSPEPLPRYECCGEIADAWRTREGFFYRMELIENDMVSVPEETEIVLWQKSGLLSGLTDAKEKELTVGDRYTVIVEPEVVDGETRYVLVSYEADNGDASIE